MPIAIIGIGCRFPGSVRSASGLWALAAGGYRTAGPVPPQRWDASALAAVHDPDEARAAGWGCFIDGDPWAWDPYALSVAPSERESVDPQFRLLAEVAWEAVEHAGIPTDRIRGSRTGVYMGTYAPDNLFREARPPEEAPNSPYLFGNFTAGAAGRIAFAMDLRGPVMVISTHCSSGLVAVDSACAALTLGECDTALAGAVLLMLSPQTHVLEAPLLLSRSGACHAFDARADGYVRGEGAGVLLLKRLTDAKRDGDRVLAVIRGSAVNNDGQSSRLTAPSTEMQQQVFRTAVERAEIDAGDVGLVEAHGPGTAVGDPVEYASIDAVYGSGRGRCALGSVKTNIGHCEPVSGIAGAIKAVECLRRGLVVPNAGFRQWNPSIPRDDASRLFVPTRLAHWPVADTPRLAAVCSYGVSGTNAHLVLEAPPRYTRATRRAPTDGRPRLLPLSATSSASLSLAAGNLAHWLGGEGADTPLDDIVHTLAVRRSHAEQRLCVVARDRHQLATGVEAFAEGTEHPNVVAGGTILPPAHPGPVFVYTGQGSQRVGMCQGVLREEPVFQDVIGRLEPLIAAEADFSLRRVLTHPEQLTGLARIQPTLFAVQLALTAMWQSWGVEPSAVIGQSLGEVAAAVVAGALTLEDGVKVICRRSARLATITGGAMASVLLDADSVRKALRQKQADQVSLAVLTGPGATVVSGDAQQVAALTARWEAAGVPARLIDVDVASHSAQVEPILVDLGQALSDIRPATATIPLYSTVTHDPLTPGPLDAAYWVRNQRDTVRFHPAVESALGRGHRVFVECTAHPLAVRPIQDSARRLGIHDVVAIGTLREGTDDQSAFLTHLAALHCAGHHGIDWLRHSQGELADVPTTSWNRERHGGDRTPYRLIAPHLVGAAEHPLLGGEVRDPERAGRWLWQTPIGPTRLPWLADHQVAGTPVLPGTAFAEMILAAGSRAFGTAHVRASRVQVSHPLVLDPEPLVTTTLVTDGGTARVEIVTHTEQGTVTHARGTVTRYTPAGTATEYDATHDPDTAAWHDSPPESLHRHLREHRDVFHGPAFTAIDHIRTDPERDEAVAGLRLAPSARVSSHALLLHPALADELVQVVASVWLDHHVVEPGPVVVAGFDDVIVLGSAAHARTAHVRIDEADELTCSATARLLTADGTLVAEIRGLRLANITPPAQRFASRLSHLAWVPEPARQDDSARSVAHWLLLTDPSQPWSRELAEVLRRRGADTSRLSRNEASTALLAPKAYEGVVFITARPGPGHDPSRAAYEETAALVAVVRRLAALRRPPRLMVLTRTSADADPAASLAAAGLGGLLRTAAYEHPELAASSLAFGPDTPLDTVADELLNPGPPFAQTWLRPDGRHVARICPGGDTPPPGAGSVLVRPQASYVVTGAMGGLGLVTVEWLAGHGAERVIACARSAPTGPTAARLTALRRAGAEVEVVLGDIAHPAVAARCVQAATARGALLKGVLHCAGVVEDATLGSLDDALLERVWRGKAAGAWTLHEATAGHDLDHFVLFSSEASLLGSPGQGGYAAANAFLDALALWRRSHALPATAVQWGAWRDVGRGQHLAARGFLTISPADGMDALERILAAGHTTTAYSPLDAHRWTAPYPHLRHSPLMAAILDTAPTENITSPVRLAVSAAGHPGERRQILETFVIDSIRELLGGTTRHIGAHTNMILLGMDSLGAVQLQQRLQRALDVTIKPGVIWVKPSPAALADWLLEHLGHGHAATGQEDVR
ncbi:type I polyketide synthase [Streptomyces sp. TLI_053]|uniref:type I polyketide synthase n=1 Tax=Streptomyces sp. TLI_053 TaxID=1855352 RepID=UPI002570F318|nr:type I polyketide synthase [Streptomyces sp. TLI_053]